MIQQSAIQAAPAAGSCLYIGQNRLGRWVVRDAECVCGGLFANQTEAIRFAMYECQRRPQSVIMLPNGLELDGADPLTPAQPVCLLSRAVAMSATCSVHARTSRSKWVLR